MKNLTQWQKNALFVLFAIGLFCIVPQFIPAPQEATPPPPTVRVTITPVQHRGVIAKIECREFVKDRLHAPSTAVFLAEKAYGLEGWADNYHVVVGIVEAKNRMGVPLRAEYRCDVHYIPSRSYEWVLDGLELSE